MYLQPTGTYGVPPVEVSDARPRYQGDPRPPSYGYYPPQQRVMPRVSRKYFMKCFFSGIQTPVLPLQLLHSILKIFKRF